MSLIFWLWRRVRVCHRRLRRWFYRLFPSYALPRYGRKKRHDQSTKDGTKPIYYRTAPKPEWVRKEIIRLKALMPQTGCRMLADVFNRRYAQKKRVTVGKTYVSYTLRAHQYEIQVLRRRIKHRKPRPVSRNLVWGIDLTGKTDTKGRLHNILGILEHHSRATLTLTAMKDKSTITILRGLLDTAERYGKPKIVRTDNEAIFTSWLFRVALWLLGIRHQRTDLHCPWQNGRVERLFGTLKRKLNDWEVDSREQLNSALTQFQFWYNHTRPHQNLDGRTPAEVWSGKNIFAARPKKEYWFEAWDGLLQGYYLRI